MTREEALQILDTIPTIGEQVDALEMAIQALEQQNELFKMGLLKDCESCKEYFRRYLDSREQEPRCQEVHAISIPANATNGDMFMVMFTRAIKSNYIESDLSMKDYVTIYLSDYEMRVSYDWWNEPYKAESEG